MFIRIVTFLSVLIFLAPPVNAGDFAERRIIGFSPDGNLFAFEQYGVQDGSGFAYSDIFIINTNTDSWIKGSPYRVQLDDETSKLNEARQKAYSLAANALKSITDKGIIAATNRPDEKLANPYRISVQPRSFILPGNTSQMDFTVELKTLPTPASCAGLAQDGTFVGFRLTRSDTNAANNIIMQDDFKIPASRNCPMDYKPADIIFHYSQDGKYVVAVLVRMETFGFEGRDGRYLAVTGVLN